MDESFLVDVGKAFDDVRQDADDNRVVQPAETGEKILHGQAAWNVFHDHEDMVRSRDDVIARNDIRVVERGHGLRFGDDSVMVAWKMRVFAFDHLHGNISTKAFLFGEIDRSHAADAKATAEFETGEIDGLKVRQRKCFGRRSSDGRRGGFGGFMRLGRRRIGATDSVRQNDCLVALRP